MGKVTRLSIKAKVPDEVGLPKHAIDSAYVSKAGMKGDYNNYRTDHLDSTPEQALLIMTTDKLKELNNEGWPVQAGDIGENITVEGTAYDDFKPESIFSVGEVEFQVSYACDPCNNLEQLPYVGKEKGKDFIKTMLHRRGWYARVLKEGSIKVGDEVKPL